MFWINVLLCYNWLLELWEVKKEEWKEWCRQHLGPSPRISYILLPNDDVIPATIEHTEPEGCLLYTGHDMTIYHRKKDASVGKPQKLPWLSLQCKVGDTRLDFSDWISDLRVYATPTLLSLVRLAAIMHNTYIPIEHCKVDVILRDGSEETYICKGRQQLCKEVPVVHRETLPYDIVDGLFF